MPGRAAAWHPPILQGNEQSRDIKKDGRHACMADILFLCLYSAKPISEMQRFVFFIFYSHSGKRNRACSAHCLLFLQSRDIKKDGRHACMADILFLCLYSAKPISEMQRFVFLHFLIFPLPSLPRKVLPSYIPEPRTCPPHTYKPAT